MSIQQNEGEYRKIRKRRIVKRVDQGVEERGREKEWLKENRERERENV
jgi:hypothetical protein